MTLSDDRGLAIRTARGDKDAFGELVRRHQTPVFNIAYRMLGNRRDAEDADREEERTIRDAILILPPRYRTVIELRHFQELSYGEIAEALGRPLSDIKSDLFRARKRLAQQLNELKRGKRPANRDRS